MSQETQDVHGASNEPAAGQPQEAPTGSAAGTMQHDAAMVFLSYFGIFALIPYLTVKDDDYVRWHAKQGLTYTVLFVALVVVLSILTVIFGFIPVIGGVVSALLGIVLSLGSLACFVIWIIALVKAFGGERWKIPLVGDLAERW